MTIKQSDAVFRGLTWVASTLLSAGIAWGSLRTEVNNLKEQASINRAAIVELQKQTAAIARMEGALNEHLRQDSKGR